MWKCAEKEFSRLKTYFYEPSRSPHASCLVVAPKATKPFIRFCGDYGVINKYLPTGHYNIPVIRHELDRIIGHKVYIDIDLTNAFHQIPLHPDTKAKLSIQTPWGQFQPKFMPEGIGPGSAVLQETVRTLFSDFTWAIVIFDNILILPEDYMQAYERLKYSSISVLSIMLSSSLPRVGLALTKFHFLVTNVPTTNSNCLKTGRKPSWIYLFLNKEIATRKLDLS